MLIISDKNFYGEVEGQYKDCNEALLQIVPRIQMGMIHEFLEDVPYLSDLQRTFYRTYIQARWEKLLLPVYEQAANRTSSTISAPEGPEL